MKIPNPLRDPDPLRDPIEAFGDLEESKYKAELDLVDRYQTFVAELLRLSLAGIGVFGFLYQSIFSGLDTTPLAPDVAANIILAKRLAAGGVISFGLCTLSALFFRFFATEGARFYIEALRLVPKQLDPDKLDCDKLLRAKQSLNKRHSKIIVCRWAKALAAVFLGLGSISIASAFCLLVWR